MYLKYYQSDSCMSDDMDQVLEALYIRPWTWSDVFSFSGENCQLRDVDLSKMEEKRAVARKWSAWPGRGPGSAFILGQLAPLHHAPCTTGATGTAGNLPVGNLEQVGWDSHCQCAFPRTSLFILIISYIGYWKSIFLCYLDDDLVIIISSRVDGNFGN